MTNTNLSAYKAVILAGGKGTRLYPITKEIPKPLIPVCKKPIINHLVDLFYSYGIKDIAVLINIDAEEDFVWWKKRYYPDANITFFREPEPLGTFGGLYLLKDWIDNKLFFMTNGDELKKVNLIEMAEFHAQKNTVSTVSLVYVPNPQDYGVAICENGLIRTFVEKPKVPPSNYINAGLYLHSPTIFEYHKEPKFMMIEKDIFPVLAEQGKLAGFEFQGKWTDTGTWERYTKALEEWEK